MIDNSTLPVTTEYAPDADYIAPPSNQQWLDGVEPDYTLPASWWNYFMQLFTNTNITAKSDVNVILTEMKSVLTAAGITVDPAQTGQLSTAIAALIQGKVDGRNAYHGIVGRSVIANPIPSFVTTASITLDFTTYPITYYNQAVPVTVSSSKTAAFPTGAAGVYYIYFDGATGNIMASITSPGFDAASNVIICQVYWNGTDYGLVSDERHQYNRNKPWHSWAHNNIGCMYTSGLNFTASGTAGAATLSLSPGSISDEDILFAVGAQTTCRQFWALSASAFTFDKVARTTPFKAGANNRPCYTRTDNFALVEMSATPLRYINTFFYASTDLGVPLSMLVEAISPTLASSNGYSDVASARAAPFPNLSTFATSRREVKAIYRVITSSAGAVQPMIASDDVRLVAAVPVGAGSANMSATAISFTPAGNISATSVQTAIEELDVEKASLVQGFKPGMIIPYSGGSLQEGFLFCDGSAISRAVYASLFTVIGVTWGAGDGVTTFNIPDSRESSLYGIGTRGSGVTEHDALTLGQFGDDRFQGFKMQYNNTANSLTAQIGTSFVYTSAAQVLTDILPVSDGPDGTPRTGKTTRGKIIGVNFMIKY